jgi:hypothetical protein
MSVGGDGRMKLFSSSDISILEAVSGVCNKLPPSKFKGIQQLIPKPNYSNSHIIKQLEFERGEN